MEREKGFEDRLPREGTATFFQTRFIHFLGGKNLLFLLLALLLAGCIIFIFNKVSFIFYPLKVLFEVVILPGVLAIIGYYLLRPFVRLADKSGKGKVPRSLVILILYVIVAALMTLISLLVYPFLRDQFTNLVQEFPTYFMKFIETTVSSLNNSKLEGLFGKYDFDYD
ncbi:MAG TPA: AI-2E family transporter, partial [Ureibacillus sp.]|nr:AI-2E family transporter [Ureibacillus sp.]